MIRAEINENEKSKNVKKNKWKLKASTSNTDKIYMPLARLARKIEEKHTTHHGNECETSLQIPPSWKGQWSNIINGIISINWQFR